MACSWLQVPLPVEGSLPGGGVRSAGGVPLGGWEDLRHVNGLRGVFVGLLVDEAPKLRFRLKPCLMCPCCVPPRCSRASVGCCSSVLGSSTVLRPAGALVWVVSAVALGRGCQAVCSLDGWVADVSGPQSPVAAGPVLRPRDCWLPWFPSLARRGWCCSRSAAALSGLGCLECWVPQAWRFVAGWCLGLVRSPGFLE